jgi:hypothetical protein
MESGVLPRADSRAANKPGAEQLADLPAAIKDADHQVQVLERGVLQPFSPPETDDA